jgi:hypothetical protein
MAVQPPPLSLVAKERGVTSRQILYFGRCTAGLPPRWVYEGADGVLMMYNEGLHWLRRLRNDRRYWHIQAAN